MGQTFFGTGSGRVSAREYQRCVRIARQHGADFTAMTLPGQGARYWFEAPNQGAPWDDRLRDAVMADVGAVRTVPA
jgi:hypothetical protein